MRTAIAAIFCVLWMIPLATAGQAECEACLKTLQLPKGMILAATLWRNDNWFALSSSGITALTTVLAERPFYAQEGEYVSPPRLPHRIVLWTTGDKGLVPEDVVECDDNFRMVYSNKRGCFISLGDLPERKVLLKVVTAIKEGAERPIPSVPAPSEPSLDE